MNVVVVDVAVVMVIIIIIMFMCYVVLSYYILCVFPFVFICFFTSSELMCFLPPMLGIIMIFVVSFVNGRNLRSHF
jgi:hypothetical protein